jgi:hypothetical protein
MCSYDEVIKEAMSISMRTVVAAHSFAQYLTHTMAAIKTGHLQELCKHWLTILCIQYTITNNSTVPLSSGGTSSKQ